MSSSRALCWLLSLKKQMHDFNFFFRSMYKTIIRLGFCDIQKNQGLGKGYHPQPTSTLIILDITKTSSNDCLLCTGLSSFVKFVLNRKENTRSSIFSKYFIFTFI